MAAKMIVMSEWGVEYNIESKTHGIQQTVTDKGMLQLVEYSEEPEIEIINPAQITFAPGKWICSYLVSEFVTKGGED